MSLKATPEVRDQIHQIPDAIGVYVFLGKNQEPVYVGKSIHLRRRVASHFSGDIRRMDVRHRRMIHAVRNIRHYRASSDLIALLLEDSLIKQYRPQYNVKQKSFRNYLYLAMSDDRFPRLLRLEEPTAAIHLFGPFPDGRFVDRLEAFLGRHFGFRDCRDDNPIKACAQYELGNCLAPCRGVDEGQEYDRMIPAVIDFLSGSSRSIIQELETSMESAAQVEHYEQAARLRDDISFATGLYRKQAFTHLFSRMELVITRQSRRIYRFRAGNFVAEGRRFKRAGDAILADEPTVNDPRFLLDKAHIVQRWLHRNRGVVNYSFELF